MQEKFSHTIPLILFTTLLPVAIGLEIGAALAGWTSDINAGARRPVLIWSLGLSILAAIMVSFHLGHPTKGHTSLRGIFHSYLSREIVFGGCFTGLLLVSTIVVYTAPESNLLIFILICTGIFGLATSFVIGRVYHLSAQISWRGLIPSAGPVLASLLTALATVFIYTRSTELSGVFRIIFCLILGLDAIFTIIRLTYYIQLKNRSYLLSYPRCKILTISCLCLKIALAAFLMLNVIRGPFPMALSFVFLQILLDRTAFYASAARQTPQTNIAIAKKQRMQDALNSTSND